MFTNLINSINSNHSSSNYSNSLPSNPTPSQSPPPTHSYSPHPHTSSYSISSLSFSASPFPTPSNPTSKSNVKPRRRSKNKTISEEIKKEEIENSVKEDKVKEDEEDINVKFANKFDEEDNADNEEDSNEENEENDSVIDGEFLNSIESHNPSIYINARRPYFESIGTSIKEAKETDEAIKLARLDFLVEKQRLFTKRELEPTEEHAGGSVFVPVPELYATVRTDNGIVLGTVKKNYHILQNHEAFDFLDSVIENGAKFEVAGTFKNESASFITCSTEPMTILDDEIVPYILFTNSFDGTASVRVTFTPIRTDSFSCLIRNMKKATDKLSIRHSSSLKQKLESSKEILIANEKYLDALKLECERWAVTPFNESSFEELARSFYPIEAENSELVNSRNERMFDAIMTAYRQSSLEIYANTAYRAIQAVADFESHKPQIRKTKKADYANIKTVLTGMPLLNEVADRMDELKKK